MKLFFSALILLASSTPFVSAQEPLPFLHKGDSIVFQGDSITDGGRQKTGLDYNHIMGQDYAYIIAAEVGFNSPERNLNFINRGGGGDWVSDLAARWQDDTIALHPTLLSILIGVNDTLSARKPAESPEEFEANYDHLLAETVAALPTTRIVLGEPFVLPVGKHLESYAKDRAEIEKRQQIVARLAAKYHLPLIRYQQLFDEACKKAPADHWSWDGIHPTYAGHGLMAHEWLKTVDAFWKAN
jgi:lysophospholipase L1-like esterase